LPHFDAGVLLRRKKEREILHPKSGFRMTAFWMGASEANDQVRMQILEKWLACVFRDYFPHGVAHSDDFVPVGLGRTGIAGAIDGVFVWLD
jgi:hypothetical protein